LERFLYAAKGLQSDAGTPENHRITVIVCNPQTREAAVATAAGGGFMGLPLPFLLARFRGRGLRRPPRFYGCRTRGSSGRGDPLKKRILPHHAPLRCNLWRKSSMVLVLPTDHFYTRRLGAVHKTERLSAILCSVAPRLPNSRRYPDSLSLSLARSNTNSSASRSVLIEWPNGSVSRSHKIHWLPCQ
jgi:hypothetical protein